MNSSEETLKWPCTFYKFRNFDEEGYHLRLLTHNEIFLSSPFLFNDPFDCRIPLRYDLEPKEKVVPWINEDYVKKNSPELNEKAALFEAERLYEKKLLEDQKNNQLIVENYIKKSLGVLSLSRSYSNLLLWSHYSNAHKGFCVGIDRRAFFYISRIYNENGYKIFIDKVDYPETNKFPIIMPLTMNGYERAKRQVLNKSKDWEYESEFRMVLVGNSNEVITLPENAIRRVIIGCDVSPEDKDKLIEIIKARKSKVHVYQAVKAPDEFKLHFKYLKL